MREWQLERGARVIDETAVVFSVWAPRARRMSVRLLGAAERDEPMEKEESGVFTATLFGVPANAEYVYRIDGERDRPDPVSRWQRRGVHGPSSIVDPGRFRWTDGAWHGAEMADLVIYELHVGTFSAAGTFDAVIERLADLRELGITAVEIMPVAEFPGGRNWGYDGVHPYAPQQSYGGPDGLKRLVDAAHGAGLAVILDVVYNHLGPEGNYLEEFGPYFTDRYRTPWGKALNFDGPDSDEIRRYFVDNALYWTSEFHIDGLRLDAVHAIYDFGALHILEEIAEAVHEEAARRGRRALVIAESDLNDPRLVRGREHGGYGLDGQWSDDFHHAVHAALTGERAGYYADFGGADALARALGERFAIAGRHSSFRRRRHGAPAGDVAADRFVVFIQNHDQVGNRALGERFGTLLPLAAQKLAAALMLLSPYVPLLFMGEEYGETHPFLYFVSHGDPDLAEAVRRGRREEFQAFGWRGEVPDPQSEETFARSRIDWDARTRAPHGAIAELYRDLLHLRRSEKALRPGGAEVAVLEGLKDGAPSIGLRYSCAGNPDLLALFNLGKEPCRVAVPGPSAWRLRLSTEDARYGGATRPPRSAEPELLALCGYEAALYERAGFG